MAAHHGSRIAGRHGPSIAVGSRAPWSGSRSSRSSSCHISWGTTCCRPTGRRSTSTAAWAPTRSSRRALVSHVATYTLAFVPALIWLGGELSLGAVIACAAGIAIPHLVQDDGRLLALYVSRVKGCDIAAFPLVGAAVDQTMHIVALFALALLAAS